MFGVKRPPSSACLDRPQCKITKDDPLSIYEATLQKLRGGSGLVSSSNGNTVKRVAPQIEGQGSTSGDAAFSTSGGELVAGLSCISDSKLMEGSCSLCSTQSRTTSCSDCRRIICQQCFRQCEQCHLDFCSYCSICNFNNEHDRVHCLECDLEEKAKEH